MLSDLRIPGVYREDVFPATAPGVLTGVPAFLGYASQGLVGEPIELTLWSQFMDTFGADTGYLSRAVHGFFSNGGEQCYVIRLNPELLAMVALAQGLERLLEVTQVDLVCVPDIMQFQDDLALVHRLQMAMIEYCDRSPHQFAILDALPIPNSTQVNNILQQRQQLQGQNAALYAPWIMAAPRIMVPPCGHVAGVIARCDRETGVHRAPANVSLEDALDLSVLFSDREQALLNPVTDVASVNCLRSLPGRGLRIWGARTLSDDSRWQQITVRRMMLTVGRWVERNLADVAFEPNDFRLWFRIEREISAYLETLFDQGALQGDIPQVAFFVKCDGETNPPEVRDAGQVITEIGLAPTVPSEFIVVRLVHGSSGVTLSS